MLFAIATPPVSENLDRSTISTFPHKVAATNDGLLAHVAKTQGLPAAGLPPRAALWTEGPKPGSRGTAVASRREEETLVFEAGDTQGRLVYVVAEP
jgi:hypothetical protein